MNNQQTTRNQIPDLSLWLFYFALFYAVFHIFPVFLRFNLKNGFRLGDLFDLFTPFVFIFTVWKLHSILLPSTRHERASKNRLPANSFLIFGSILFVEGHGMHLAANALGRMIEPVVSPVLYSLDYFFDEILGHFLWDGGIAMISIGLILRCLQKDTLTRSSVAFPLITLGGLLYGFTYFINAIEGQTVSLTLPLAILIPIFIVLNARKMRIPVRSSPLLLFFLIGYVWSLGLFIGWRLWQGGFPEFSELDWI
jgi:hypothetical protein